MKHVIWLFSTWRVRFSQNRGIKGNHKLPESWCTHKICLEYSTHIVRHFHSLNGLLYGTLKKMRRGR